jgi:hypothetical protein
VFAFSGAILYGVIFMAYWAYYDALNLSPEDVGVDTAYILVRSPGFLFLSIAAAGLSFSLARLTDSLRDWNGSTWPSGRWWSRVVLVTVLNLLLVLYLIQFYQVLRGVVPLLIVLSVILWLDSVALRVAEKRGYRYSRYVPLGSAVFIALVLPAVLLNLEVRSLGQYALSGGIVSPIEAFGIPIIDVSAPPVKLHWSDPRTPRPYYFGNAATPEPIRGTLLGQTDTAVVANLNYENNFRIVRFDAGQVIVEFERPS